MPKCFAKVQGAETIGGKLHAWVDLWFTDNAGTPLQALGPEPLGQGYIPRQQIPYAGAASTLISAIATRAIGIAAGKGVTIVSTDVTIDGVVQAP